MRDASPITQDHLIVPAYRLVTTEILYHMPDFPGLLQTFIWQTHDVAPRFPRVMRFLDFWTRDLAGTLHSVTLVQAGPEAAARWRFADGAFTLH